VLDRLDSPVILDLIDEFHTPRRSAETRLE
jgi:hypothetical protein